mmetsp:Transcript_2630/g.4073  ORF Transcript_2630/g.4073 Transcript_2630/m.4073 type:complete len:82 (+) Transcript_2630:617-862(+)
MVAKTNTSKNWNPKLPSFGVRVSGLDKKNKSAKYGNSDDAKMFAAKSAELRSGPSTDHALTAVTKLEQCSIMFAFICKGCK